MALKKASSAKNTTEKIDAYIDNAEVFAQPILTNIRRCIHQLNIGLEEEWKWSSPNFSCMGLVCMIWSFKNHSAIHFFKGALMKDTYNVLIEAKGGNVSARSIKFHSIKDVDLKIIREYILEAVQINLMGLKVESAEEKKSLKLPIDFIQALAKKKLAKKSFEVMSPSHQKEYVLSITEAKKEETRWR